jgi:hypothetical protein
MGIYKNKFSMVCASMEEKDLLYEDKITVSSWSKSLPFVALGFIIMILLYFLMPFPIVTIYDSLINLIFAISIGLVLVIIGIYFFITYRNMRYAVTKNSVIIEFGRERKTIPISKITSIKRLDSMTFGQKFKVTSENVEKVIFATIRNHDLLKIYQDNSLVAIITPVDTEDFLIACNIKK